MVLPRRVLPAILVLVCLPSSAHATEGFVGITPDGLVTRFTTQAPADGSRPSPVRGLGAGERPIAVAHTRVATFVVGSTARLYRLDVATLTATPVGAPFEAGLRGTRFSLAATADATAGRLVSDVGQDLLIDLATGAARPGPGLRAPDGAPLRPAVAFDPAGRLVGVDPRRRVLVREQQPGGSVLAVTPLRLPRLLGRRLPEPVVFALASDGRAFTASRIGRGPRIDQSLLATVRPGGELRLLERPGPFALTALAALGSVPEDTAPPEVTVEVPTSVTLRELLDRRVRLRLAADEGFLYDATIAFGGRRATFVTVGSRFYPGSTGSLLTFGPRDAGALRRLRPRRVRLTVAVRDWAGNATTRTIVLRVR